MSNNFPTHPNHHRHQGFAAYIVSKRLEAQYEHAVASQSNFPSQTSFSPEGHFSYDYIIIKGIHYAINGWGNGNTES